MASSSPLGTHDIGPLSDIDLREHDHGESETDWTYITTATLHPDNGSSRATHDPSDIESDEEYAQQMRDNQAGVGGDSQRQQSRTPKAGGYDSRIEQILYENPKMPIMIVDAGRSAENGGKYIVYTIRTGVSTICLLVTAVAVTSYTERF